MEFKDDTQLIVDPDTIPDTINPIAKLLRVAVASFGVTHNKFLRKHTETVRRHNRTQGVVADERKLSTDRGNFRQTVTAEVVTWKQFHKFIIYILQMHIKEISITLVDDDGKEYVISTDHKEIKKYDDGADSATR